MKRFDIAWHDEEMVYCDDGCYVDFREVEALIKERDRYHTALERIAIHPLRNCYMLVDIAREALKEEVYDK